MEDVPQKQPKRKRGRPRKGDLITLPAPRLVSHVEPDPSVATSNALTKDTLPEYQENQLVSNAPRLIPVAMACLEKGASGGSLKAAEMILQTYNYIPKSSGISIINNIQQNSVLATVNDDGAYFERIIRKVEGQDRAG